MLVLFSVVRWTNVFDPSRYIYKGDLIGGPLSTVFGPAIEDIDLSTVDRLSKGFTHTSYWSEGQSDNEKRRLMKLSTCSMTSRLPNLQNDDVAITHDCAGASETGVSLFQREPWQVQIRRRVTSVQRERIRPEDQSLL